MGFTYEAEALSSDNLYQVRLAIGDTNADKWLLDDEEIRYFIDQASDNVTLAAIKCCYAISAKYAKFSKKRTSGVEVEIEDVAGKYQKMAQRLSRQLVSTGSFYAITTKSEKEAIKQNSDLLQPAFSRGMMDNPEAGSSSNSDDLRSDTT